MKAVVKAIVITLSVVGALFTALLAAIYINERKDRFGKIY